MPWPVVNARSNRLRIVAAGLLAGSLLAWLPAFNATAVDSEIGVSVCGGSVPPAQIDITQPLSDSVVGQSPVTFRGTVANATQVEISINSQYTATFALAANATTFEQDVTLPVGTNTVAMTANAVCGGQGATDSAVVTFQPATAPSSGESTPTELDGTVTLDGTPVDTAAIKDEEIVQVIERLPIIGAAVSVVADFAVATGLEATISGNNTPVIAGTARVALTVAALSSIVMASSVAPLAAQAIPGLSEMFNVNSHRSMMYLGWVVRGVGLVALALAYFV